MISSIIITALLDDLSAGTDTYRLDCRPKTHGSLPGAFMMIFHFSGKRPQGLFFYVFNRASVVQGSTYGRVSV